MSRQATTQIKQKVSLETAATTYDVSPRTIRRAIAEGRITGYRFGKRILRVDLDEVDAAFRVVPTAPVRDAG